MEKSGNKKKLLSPKTESIKKTAFSIDPNEKSDLSVNDLGANSPNNFNKSLTELREKNEKKMEEKIEIIKGDISKINERLDLVHKTVEENTKNLSTAAGMEDMKKEFKTFITKDFDNMKKSLQELEKAVSRFTGPSSSTAPRLERNNSKNEISHHPSSSSFNTFDRLVLYTLLFTLIFFQIIMPKINDYVKAPVNF